MYYSVLWESWSPFSNQRIFDSFSGQLGDFLERFCEKFRQNQLKKSLSKLSPLRISSSIFKSLILLSKTVFHHDFTISAHCFTKNAMIQTCKIQKIQICNTFAWLKSRLLEYLEFFWKTVIKWWKNYTVVKLSKFQEVSAIFSKSNNI